MLSSMEQAGGCTRTASGQQGFTLHGRAHHCAAALTRPQITLPSVVGGLHGTRLSALACAGGLRCTAGLERPNWSQSLIGGREGAAARRGSDSRALNKPGARPPPCLPAGLPWATGSDPETQQQPAAPRAAPLLSWLHSPPLTAGRLPASAEAAAFAPRPPGLRLLPCPDHATGPIMDSEKVAQFVGITGASESTAAFYLESCGGHAERAIQSFFDAGGAEVPAGGAPAPAAAPAATTGPSSLLAEAAAARAARAAATGGAAAGAGPSSSRPAGGRRPAAAAGNVRSLGDIGGEESESDDEYNELYVGGDKR